MFILTRTDQTIVPIFVLESLNSDHNSHRTILNLDINKFGMVIDSV